MKILKCRAAVIFATVFLSTLEGSVSVAFAQRHWREIAHPTTKDLLKLSFVSNEMGWAAGRAGVIIKTTDAGINWQQQNSGVTTDVNNIFMVNPRIGWAITWIYYQDTATYYGSRILKTTNGGSTWQDENFLLTGKYFYAITFLDSLHGWVGGTEGALYRTTNGGDTWLQCNVRPSNYSAFPIRKLQFFNSTFGFGMGGHFDLAGVAWKTIDGGLSWDAESVSPEPVYEMQFVDSLNIIGISGDFKFGASMIRTSDAGRSWNYTPLDLFGLPRAMAFRTKSEGWVGLGNFFIITQDTAHTWTIAEATIGRNVFDFEFTDSSTGYAATDSGAILKYSTEVTSVVQKPTVPQIARLFQNYPNPFNPATIIRYSVGYSPADKAQTLQLKVYDLSGREIADLVNSARSVGGYSVTWKPGPIASGIYFYKLTYGSFVDVKKMIFLK